MVEPRSERVLVWTILASQFGPPFMFAGVAVALPAMGRDLQAGATSVGLVETLFLAGAVAFLLPVGRLADATDKRTLYKLGLLCFGVTSILISALSAMPAILAIRFVQGAASAVFSATGPAILADIVPAERRGRAYGWSLGAIYAGLTSGPIIAGFLVDAWGWRAVFLAGAAANLLMLLLIQLTLESSWRWRPGAVHAPSAALVVTAVLCLVAGSATVRQGPAGFAYLTGGVGLAIVFVLTQRRLERPLLDVVALLQNRVLWSALTVQCLLYMTAFTSIFMLSIYMQVSLGHPPRTAGYVLAIGTIFMAAMAPVSGVLADRFKPLVLSSLGVAAVSTSSVLATSLDQHTGLMFVTVLLAVQGIGFALFSTPNMAVIMGSVPANATSMASALGAKARSVGMVAGMLITSILISVEIGHDAIDQHPVRFIDILTTVFTILAVLSALGFLVGITTGRAKSR